MHCVWIDRLDLLLAQDLSIDLAPGGKPVLRRVISGGESNDGPVRLRLGRAAELMDNAHFHPFKSLSLVLTLVAITFALVQNERKPKIIVLVSIIRRTSASRFGRPETNPSNAHRYPGEQLRGSDASNDGALQWRPIITSQPNPLHPIPGFPRHCGPT